MKEPTPAAALDQRTKTGVTTEGLPCEVTLYFAPGAPEGALPERIAGYYQAQDGSGTFEIVRDGDRYRNTDTGDTGENAADLLPWVVVGGVW